MTTVAPDAELAPRHRGFAAGVAARYLRDRRGVVAVGAFLVLVGFCLVVPLVVPHDPYAVEFGQKLQWPTLSHPLGTDMFGRDLLVRMALGGRASIGIAFAALALIAVVGTLYGAVAGMAGGRVDAAMMRVLDGFLAVPRFPVIVIILVVAGLDTSVLTLVLALAIPSWMVTARLVRAEVVALRTREFVRAAEAVGARRHQVLVRHVVPNALGIVVVALLLELPGVVLGEAFASALGLGLDAPAATWGNIAYDGIQTGRLYEVVLPSLAIALFAVAANLSADGLHDALDPRRSAAVGRARR